MEGFKHARSDVALFYKGGADSNTAGGHIVFNNLSINNVRRNETVSICKCSNSDIPNFKQYTYLYVCVRASARLCA